MYFVNNRYCPFLGRNKNVIFYSGNAFIEYELKTHIKTQFTPIEEGSKPSDNIVYNKQLRFQSAFRFTLMLFNVKETLT